MAEVVGEDVHLEGRSADVHLVTDVTGLGCFCGESFVSLLVTGQVGAGGKVLTTFIALVLGFSRRVLLVL